MTNEEKAKNMASVLVSEDQNNQPLVDLLLQMAQWKDEQHKQELIRIYNFVSPYLTPEANNDLKIIIGIC